MKDIGNLLEAEAEWVRSLGGTSISYSLKEVDVRIKNLQKAAEKAQLKAQQAKTQEAEALAETARIQATVDELTK